MGKLTFFKIISLGIIKEWKICLLNIAIGIQIFLPSLGEAFPFSFGEFLAENVNGMPVLVEGLVQNIKGCAVDGTQGLDVGDKKRQFFVESRTESIIETVKSLPLFLFSSNDAGEQDADKRADKCACDGYEYLFQLFCGLFCGLLSFIIMFWPD